MPDPNSFDYTIIRVVPREERAEFVNVGVILYCRVSRFLSARIAFNPQRLAALAPNIDPEAVKRHLEAIPKICSGSPDAGPIGQLSQSERFQWLAAPRNTIIQTSPVHCGLCSDPAAMLDHLMEIMVT